MELKRAQSKRRQIAKCYAHEHGDGITECSYVQMYCDKYAAKHRETNLPKPWEPKQLRFNVWHRLRL